MNDRDRRLHAVSGSTVIDPARPVVLGGNSCPELLIDDVADSIEANIVLFRCGVGGEPVVLVSFDLLYVGALLRRLLLEKLGSSVASENLFLAASHTHRAPMTDPTKSALGSCDPEYVESVAHVCADLIRNLLAADAKEVMLTAGGGTHAAGVNRRLRRAFTLSRRGLKVRPVIMAPNPLARCDNTFRRLRVSSDDGVVADLWTTALHPTAFPSRYRVSSDYPGIVRRTLRSQVGQEHPVLFFQGFSANIRPNAPSIRWGLKRLLLGPIFSSFTPQTYQEWAHDLSQRVSGAVLVATHGKGLSAVRLPFQAAQMVLGAPNSDEGAVHEVRVGATTLIGVPAEVSAEYMDYMCQESTGADTWGVGCLDHVWGYVPTHAMLGEGGYEADGFCAAFAVEAVNPEVEANLGALLASMTR